MQSLWARVFFQKHYKNLTNSKVVILVWNHIGVSKTFKKCLTNHIHYILIERITGQLMRVKAVLDKMMATQNIDTLGPIWTFSLRGVLTFVASGLDINGCVLSYFEGTANLHCHTSFTLTTLHCRKVSFLQCCHMKRYNKIFTKMWGVYSLLWDTVYILNKIINSTLLFRPMYVKYLFLTNIVHKSV